MIAEALFKDNLMSTSTWTHMLFVCQGQVKKIKNCSNELLRWFQRSAWHTPTCKLSFWAACRKPVNLCPFSFPLFPVKINISSHVAELEREDANEPQSSFSTLSEPETTLQCYILWAMLSLFKGTCRLTGNWEGRASCRLEWSLWRLYSGIKPRLQWPVFILSSLHWTPTLTS